MTKIDENLYKAHVQKVNKLLSYVLSVFLVPLGIIYYGTIEGVFNYPISIARQLLLFTIITDTIFILWSHTTTKYLNFYKYVFAIVIQVNVFALSCSINIELSSSTLLMPLMTIMYLNPLYTVFACVLATFSESISKIVIAPDAVAQFWPNYSTKDFITIHILTTIMEKAGISFVLYTTTSIARKLLFEIQNKGKNILESRNEIVFSFSDLIEMRNGSVSRHSKRTSKIVELLSKYAQEHNLYGNTMTKENWDLMIVASPLHDIGKLKIPDSILLKPTKLTEHEFEIIKTHTSAGAEIIDTALSTLNDDKYLKTAVQMAKFHHERWDGTGYPNGLKGEQIPIPARIMAIADVFDALCSKKTYKEACTMNDAFSIIEENRDSYFEPCLVDAFKELRPEIEKLYCI